MSSGIKQNVRASAAGGAAVDTGAVDVKGCDALAVVADNTAGAGARNLTLDFLADDKTTVLFSVTAAVTNGTRAGFAVGQGAVAGTGITPISLPPPSYVRAQLAAAGAAAASVAVYGR